VLTLTVDCGAKPGEMLLPVVMTGEAARTIGALLRQGVAVRACGSLQATHGRIRAGSPASATLGVEVVADEVTLVDAPVRERARVG